MWCVIGMTEKPVNEEYAIKTFICAVTTELCDYGGECSKCEFAHEEKKRELLPFYDVSKKKRG